MGTSEEKNPNALQVITKNELNIEFSIPLIDKLLSPTIEYAGEQIRDLVKWMVDAALKKIREVTGKASFRGSLQFEQELLVEIEAFAITTDALATVQIVNPYQQFPDWSWPLEDTTLHTVFLNKFLPDNNTECDRAYFLMLLSQSLSLSKGEKRRVVDAWPTLNQWQVDALVETFEDERQEFIRLLPSEEKIIWRLIFKCQLEWAQLLLSDDALGIDIYILPALNGRFRFPPFVLWHEYWGMCGKVLIDVTKNYAAASVALRHALRLNPTRYYYWRALGYCYGKLKYFVPAAEVVKRATELSDKKEGGYLDIAEYYLLSDRIGEADRYLSLAREHLTQEYEYVHDMLDTVSKFLQRIYLSEPESVRRFLTNPDMESSWDWQYLREKVSGTSSHPEESRKNLARLLQTLVSRQAV